MADMKGTAMPNSNDNAEFDAMLEDSSQWEEPTPGPRRKSEIRKRGSVVSVRLLPEELHRIQVAATAANLSVSGFLRDCALKRAGSPTEPELHRWFVSMLNDMWATNTSEATQTAWLDRVIDVTSVKYSPLEPLAQAVA